MPSTEVTDATDLRVDGQLVGCYNSLDITLSEPFPSFKGLLYF